MKDRLNAVICSLNSQYIHSSLAPWCLLAGVEKYCHDGITAKVVEGTINEEPQKVLERIISSRPMVLGFCCYIWNVTTVIALVKMVKEQLPECIIFLGGPEVSYNAKEMLKNYPMVEYVVSGEGEEPVARILNAIANQSEITGIPGLCYRRGDEIVVADSHTPCEIPPSPYTESYFEALKGRIAYLETSRGCPFSCAFCLSGRCGGVRHYDLERAKHEMLLLANSGTQTIKLVDRTFNANSRRAKEMFRFIIEHYRIDIPEGVCFHFEIAGDLLDEESIALIGKAPVGSMQFEIGLQSFNAQTLMDINRKTNVNRLKKNIAALLKNENAHIHIDLIAGLPHEDMKSFKESFNTAFELSPHMLQMGFLKLLHGAPMRENSEEFPCDYDIKPPYVVKKTPWLSEGEMMLLHQTEHTLDRLYNRGRFHRTLAYLLSTMQKTPFDIFFEFGQFLDKTDEVQKSLDDFTALVFSYFASQTTVDKTTLRDCMVCDRLATNSSGKLPKALRVEDPMLKMSIKKLEQINGRKKAVKRGYALLYGKSLLAYVDYEDKNPVTGEYVLHTYPVNLET